MFLTQITICIDLKFNLNFNTKFVGAMFLDFSKLFSNLYVSIINLDMLDVLSISQIDCNSSIMKHYRSWQT